MKTNKTLKTITKTAAITALTAITGLVACIPKPVNPDTINCFLSTFPPNPVFERYFGPGKTVLETDMTGDEHVGICMSVDSAVRGSAQSATCVGTDLTEKY